MDSIPRCESGIKRVDVLFTEQDMFFVELCQATNGDRAYRTITVVLRVIPATSERNR